MESEKIKKQIELETEELKFYQSFFLPIGTGVIATFLAVKTLGVFIASILIVIGILFLLLLFLYRNKIVKRIKLLIEKF
jgi:hypothetical protein